VVQDIVSVWNLKCNPQTHSLCFAMICDRVDSRYSFTDTGSPPKVSNRTREVDVNAGPGLLLLFLYCCDPSNIEDVDYSTSIYGGTLKGLYLGVIQGFFSHTASNESTPVNTVMKAMISKLAAVGAIIIPINSTLYNATAISAALDMQTSEYRQSMDTYPSMPSLGGTHPTTLSQLYRSGKSVVIPVSTSMSSPRSPPRLLAWQTSVNTIAQLGIQYLTTDLRNTFTSHTLDVVICHIKRTLS
jgi:hypothetical protein